MPDYTGPRLPVAAPARFAGSAECHLHRREGDPHLARPLSRDTHPTAEDVQIALLSSMPAWRKVELTCDACRTARLLALAGLRDRHPTEPPALLARRLAAILLGDELAERVYGPGPGRNTAGF
ncbi:MAG: hypothetical protein HYV63_06320 [Candidatus Schekmanbacteria bacterium]|nr:hypothetical protein [Candidatus Schekmanbacteria bacterium]